jgi:hypothetical protein
MKVRAGLLLPVIAVLPCIAHCGASAPDPEPGTPGAMTQEPVSLGAEPRGGPLTVPSALAPSISQAPPDDGGPLRQLSEAWQWNRLRHPDVAWSPTRP